MVTVKFAAICCLQLLMMSLVHLFGIIGAAQFAGLTRPAAPAELQATDSPSPKTTRSDAQYKDSATGVSRQGLSDGRRNMQLQMFGMVLLVCSLNSAALIIWIRGSTLSGFALIANTFFIFFACMTVMPQVETYVFVSRSSGIIRTAVIMGLVVCGLWSLAAVPILNRWKQSESSTGPWRAFDQSASKLIGLVGVSAVSYVILYLLFGYFVAWQNDELRALYGGGDVIGFWQHISSRPVWNRVIPLQLVRGIAWTVLCLLMLRSLSGSLIQRTICVALVFSVVMNAQLLIPNPFMSSPVRLIHFVETAASNFLFGAFCVQLWGRAIR